MFRVGVWVGVGVFGFDRPRTDARAAASGQVAAGVPPVRMKNLRWGWILWRPTCTHVPQIAIIVLDRRYSYATTAILSDNAI